MSVRIQPTDNTNCGIGPGGFQPGNKCAKGGSGFSKSNKETGDNLMSMVVKVSDTVGERSLQHYVVTNGKTFEGSTLPKGVKKGESKQCFKNALNLALEKDWDYVEGYATFKDIGGLPIHHAWNVNKSGKVVDNTWGASKDNLYYGVSIRPKEMMEYVEQTKTYGLSVWKNATPLSKPVNSK